MFVPLTLVDMATSLRKLPPQFSVFVCFMVQDAHRLSLAECVNYKVCIGLLSFKFEESISLLTPMVIRDFPKNTRRKTRAIFVLQIDSNLLKDMPWFPM